MHPEPRAIGLQPGLAALLRRRIPAGQKFRQRGAEALIVTLAAFAALSFLLLPLPGLAAEPADGDGSLLIGMSAPFSGPNRAYGEEMRSVIDAYFRQVNETGGVNGRKLSLLALDDAYETERSVANTRRLIERHDVFALLQYYGSSPTTEAMNAVFGPAGVPLIGAISGAASLRQSPQENPHNRYMFNVRASYADEADAIVGQLAMLGIRNIAVFYQNDGFGLSGLAGVNAALKKYGLEASAQASVERNSLDVAAAAKTIAEATPQAVVMVSLFKPTAEFIRALRAYGQHPQFMTLSSVGADLLAAELGEAARGIGVSQVMPYPFTDTAPIVGEYRRLLPTNATASYYGLEAYVSAKLLVQALAMSSRGPTFRRERLVRTLENLREIDLGGYRLRFSPSERGGSHYVDLTVIGAEGRILR